MTASVDELGFHHAIKLGEIVTLQASVNRAFRTSMEIGVTVTAHGKDGSPSRRTNTAYLTFVAIDEQGKPVPVPGVSPETAAEKRRFEEALERRQLRLTHRRSEE